MGRGSVGWMGSCPVGSQDPGIMTQDGWHKAQCHGAGATLTQFF